MLLFKIAAHYNKLLYIIFIIMGVLATNLLQRCLNLQYTNVVYFKLGLNVVQHAGTICDPLNACL